MQLTYLGPEGTFTHSAARHFASIIRTAPVLRPCATISEVVRFAVSDGSFGVVPYHNLIDGLVQVSLDSLLLSNAVIYAAMQQPIRIAVGRAPGAVDSAPVYSHTKALAQCADWLDRHAPAREQVAVASTAAGVTCAVEHDALALGDEAHLRGRGLEIVQADASSPYFGRTNYTEFLLIGPPGLTPPIDATNTRCVIACAPQTDRPGLLADILGLLSMFGFNLARLHSRPAVSAAPTQLDPQVFYLEIAGAPSDDELAICARALRQTLGGPEAMDVLIELGRYPLSGLTDHL
ncbi:MAG: prephenate dehydratase domain-containing protein [Pseudomonadota bacterium]